jgi:hypothetical protein
MIQHRWLIGFTPVRYKGALTNWAFPAMSVKHSNISSMSVMVPVAMAAAITGALLPQPAMAHEENVLENVVVEGRRQVLVGF